MIFQILKRWQYNINAMCYIQVCPRESIKIVTGNLEIF